MTMYKMAVELEVMCLTMCLVNVDYNEDGDIEDYQISIAPHGWQETATPPEYLSESEYSELQAAVKEKLEAQ